MSLAVDVAVVCRRIFCIMGFNNPGGFNNHLYYTHILVHIHIASHSLLVPLFESWPRNTQISLAVGLEYRYVVLECTARQERMSSRSRQVILLFQLVH